MTTLRRSIAVWGFTLLTTNMALAAPCDVADLVDTLPPDDARQVPLDTPLYALYDTRAEYLEEDVILIDEDGNERVMGATFSSAEGLLSITPPDGLAPESQYTIEWPGLRGIGTASVGKGRRVRFTTGAEGDEADPDFRGVRAVEWDFEREQDGCTETLEERFRFDLELRGASDDGGEDSLLLLVFQTRGHDDDEPVQVLARRWPEKRRVTIERSTRDARGEVCFSALVRDLSGRVSSSADREVCTETVEPPFFEGCSVRGRSGRSFGFSSVLLAWGFMLWVWRRPRRGA